MSQFNDFMAGVSGHPHPGDENYAECAQYYDEYGDGEGKYHDEHGGHEKGGEYDEYDNGGGHSKGYEESYEEDSYVEDKSEDVYNDDSGKYRRRRVVDCGGKYKETEEVITVEEVTETETPKASDFDINSIKKQDTDTTVDYTIIDYREEPIITDTGDIIVTLGFNKDSDQMQALYRRWELEVNGSRRVLKNIDYSALDLEDAITLVIKVRVKNDSVDLTN